MKNFSIKESTEFFIKKAGELLGYDQEMIDLLITPSRQIQVELPIRLDSGKVRVFSGFRVQHHNARGPYKGGLRYHPSVDMDDSCSLAMLMSLKTSLVNIPLGGAKGGINCDPKSLSQNELQKLTRKYVQKMHRNLGPNHDIPAPDIGTDGQIMAWIYNEYSIIHGGNFGIVTGKPLWLQGSSGREEATGYGVAFIIQQYLKFKKDASPKKIIIQGFGNVGQYAYKFLEQKGHIIIGIASSKGAVYNSKGISYTAAKEYYDQHGSFLGGNLGEELSSNDILIKECDILIPAALGGVIHQDNASSIKAKVIAEGANAPITCKANDILQEMNTDILPDILTNSGGVIVSYFEWVQNMQHYTWEYEQVMAQLDRKLEIAFKETCQMAHEKKLNLRSASYLIAMERLQQAYMATDFL